MAIVTAPDGALLRSGTSVNLTSADWTIFLWAAPVTSTPTGGIFREYYQIGDVGYVYLGSQGDTNDVMLLLSDDGTTNFYESTHVATPLGDWFWCAATYDSTTHDLKFYVNSATAIDTLNHNLSSGFNFGTLDEQSCTFGAETQVAYERIWQRKLTGAQLVTEASSPIAVQTTNLISDTPLLNPTNNLNNRSGTAGSWTIGAGAFEFVAGPVLSTAGFLLVPPDGLTITDEPAALVTVAGAVDSTFAFPATERGDILLTNTYAVTREETPGGAHVDALTIYTPVQTAGPVVTSIASSDWNNADPVRGNLLDAFFVGVGQPGITAAKVYRVSTAGAVGATVWTLPSESSTLNSLAVSPDETTLYWTSRTKFGAIHAYDLVNQVALSDIVASGMSNLKFWGVDLFVMQSSDILAMAQLISGGYEVWRFNALGVFQLAYTIGGSEGSDPFIALDPDPDVFWVRTFPSPSGINASTFQKFRMSDGTVLTSFSLPTDRAGGLVPMSCPFIVLPSATPGGTGTIIVVKQNLITGDTTEFDFGTNGAPLTPTTFTLADGDSQTFNSIPVGSGYAINENVQANWTVTYTVSNGSPVDNLFVDSGETVTVTAINTFNPPSETDPIRRLRQFEIPTDENKQIFISKLEVLLQSGVGLVNGQGSDPQVAFSLSRDGGKTWGPEHWTSAGKMGEYLQRVIWRQLGQARNPVGRIVVSDPVFWALIDAYFDATPGTS